MGMQEWLAGAPSGNGKRESDEICAIIRAENLSSRFRSHHKQRNRNHIDVGGFPDLAFDAHTGFELFDSVARSDDDAVFRFFERSPWHLWLTVL